jgi:hypothetical protein
MLPNKLTLQGLTVAAAIFATTLSAAARAPSAQSFDGRWSVLVFTDYGTCGGGYRYGVQISDGRVFYAGSSDVDVSGRVSPRGQVRVQVRQSDQSATGTGRLSQTSGGGRWSGSSPTRQCAGHWVAERRDF